MPAPSLKRVAVTGASGTVGQFVVRRLLAEGVEVCAATRAPQIQQELQQQHAAQPTLEWRAFSLGDAGSSAALLSGCDALVHCAFSHVPHRYRGGEGNAPAQFWHHNLAGTLELLEACATANTSRVILLSSRAVFGSSRSDSDAVLHDDSPTLPDTHYGALKRAEESLLRLLVRTTALQGASVRATGVYGVLKAANESKWYDDCKAVLQDRPITRVRASTEVHGNDLAAAVWQLLNADQPALNGRVYNCSDQLISTRMLGRALNQLTGKQLPLPPLAAPNGRPMACAALRALGWKPGGNQQWLATLATLLDVARSTS